MKTTPKQVKIATPVRFHVVWILTGVFAYIDLLLIQVDDAFASEPSDGGSLFRSLARVSLFVVTMALAYYVIRFGT